jgi:serine/threonine-protein kinase
VTNPQFTAAFQSAIAGRFVIQNEIGRGTRAIVYRALDATTGETVALKVLRADLASALDSTRFRKQMENAATVEHPGIVPLIAVGEAAGRLFIARPFIEGESLRERLNREGTLELSPSLTIARQVADALGAAHAVGVLHKDVKPENIFLTDSRAILMDLGLSRAITRAMEETMTGSGLTLGTPSYMSPEHASGGVEIDARADLYSLGCVLYEMLTGQPPFSGGPAHSVLMRTLKEKPVPIRDLRDSIPADVGTAIDRMLEKMPADRYSDAAHVIDALGQFR